MKKAICFFVAVIVCLTFVGCKNKPAAEEDGQKTYIIIENKVADQLKAIGISYYLGDDLLGSRGMQNADGSLLGEEKVSFDFIEEDFPEGKDLSDFRIRVSVTDSGGESFDACEAFCVKQSGAEYLFRLKEADGRYSLWAVIGGMEQDVSVSFERSTEGADSAAD